MRNIFFITSLVLAASCSCLNAQNTELQGTYLPQSGEAEFQIRLNPDNTADALMATGTYSVVGNTVELKFSQGSMFTVTPKQGNSSQLQLTFFPNNDEFNPQYIYIGYETAQGQVQYESLYNKVQDDELTIEIPRTPHLYLVNAYRPTVLNDTKAPVLIEKFAIDKETNALQIAIDLSKAVSNELTLTYNASKQQLTYQDRSLSERPVVFSKKLAPDSATLLPASTEKVNNWQHLIAFHEEVDIPIYNPDAPNAKKLEKANSLMQACALATKNKTLIALFYQPENRNAAQEYADFLTWYEQNGAEYVTEADETAYQYQPYLATPADAKWLKKKGIAKEDQLIILSAEGDIIYHEPFTPASVTNNVNVFSRRLSLSLLHAAAIAQLADKVLSNPKASISRVQATFEAINSDYGYNLALLAKNRPQIANTERETDIANTIAERLDEYKPYFENFSSLYQLQLTPQQLLAQWKRLVDAHESDKELHPAFAALAAANISNNNVAQKAFYTNLPDDETTLKTVTYLLRFFADIKAHNDALPQPIYPYTKGVIRLEHSDVENVFNSLLAANEAQYLPSVKNAYAIGVTNGFFSPISYIEFLYDNNLTTDAARAFSSYYQRLMAADSHLIAALDKDFSVNDDNFSWKYYKMRFANRANNIAWKVYENRNTEPSLLTEAYQWAKAAVQLEPENPYYLDTLAHLMYANGDTQQAITTEEKAVQLLSTTDDGRDEEREQVKANLEKMKKGAL